MKYEGGMTKPDNSDNGGEMIFSEFVKAMEEKDILKGNAQQGLALLKFIIEGLTEEKRRHILYLLMRTPGIHLCGIRKVFGYNKATVGDILLSFELNGLIRKMTNEEKQDMRKYRVALKLSHHHFDETDFYVLTSAWREVLATVTWDDLIDDMVKTKAENWTKEMYRTTHANVEKRVIPQRNGVNMDVEEKEAVLYAYLGRINNRVREMLGDDEYNRHYHKWRKIKELLKKLYHIRHRKELVKNAMERMDADFPIEAIMQCLTEENPALIIERLRD